MRQRKADRHLPRCMYHKHGAFWLVRDGKWHRLGTDLTAALAEYGRRLASPRGGMAELIEEAFTHLSETASGNAVAESTRKQYRICANKLKEILADFEPSQVKPKDVVGIKRMYAAHPNMGNRMLSVLRKVFDYALDEELVDANPCIGIKRRIEAKRQRLISHAEWDAIRDKAVPQLQCIMDLAYATAQRIMDVVNIRLADLGDEGIYFRAQKTGDRKIVRWTTDMRAAVDRAKQLHGNVRAFTLFHGRSGKAPAYRTLHDKWTRACGLAGVTDALPNDQRAMSATDANRQSKDAQALLGHTTPAHTKRYLRSKEVPVVDGPIRHLIDADEKAG